MSGVVWDWVDHVVVAGTATGAVVLWLGRVLFVPSLKQHLDDLLQDKFAEAKNELDKRHVDNRKELERLSKVLENSVEDRRKLHEQMAKLMEELGYVRGRTSGRFKKVDNEQSSE